MTRPRGDLTAAKRSAPGCVLPHPSHAIASMRSGVFVLFTNGHARRFNDARGQQIFDTYSERVGVRCRIPVVATSCVATLIEDDIAGDGEQPCPRRPVSVVRDLRVLPSPPQRLRNHFFGAAPVTGQQQGTTPQCGSVL